MLLAVFHISKKTLIQANDSNIFYRRGWIGSSGIGDMKWCKKTNNEYIKEIKGDSRQKIIEFVKSFCGPAIQLRETVVLNQKVFHKGLADQLSAGKSKICGSNKVKLFRFEDKVTYKKGRPVPLQYTVSNNIIIKRYLFYVIYEPITVAASSSNHAYQTFVE